MPGVAATRRSALGARLAPCRVRGRSIGSRRSPARGATWRRRTPADAPRAGASAWPTLFDQYVTYRPDWLRHGRGRQDAGTPGQRAAARADEAWQAALWRRLAAELGSRHPADGFLQGAAGRRRRACGERPPAARACTCSACRRCRRCTSRCCRGSAGCIEVHVYALNPCREYWFDIVDAAPAGLPGGARPRRASRGRQPPAGRPGAARRRRISVCSSTPCGEGGGRRRAVRRPARASRCSRSCSASILDLSRTRARRGRVDGRRPQHRGACLPLADTRARSAAGPAARRCSPAPDAPAPGDILVVTPDLEAAAPLIDAVFGTAPPERRIPYTVTGPRAQPASTRRRARARRSAGARRFAFPGERRVRPAAAAARRAPLRARRDDLERVHGWLQDAGIHWALDAEQRASLGLPADGDTQLRRRAGRGCSSAMRCRRGSAEPFAGLLPAGDAEGARRARARRAAGATSTRWPGCARRSRRRAAAAGLGRAAARGAAEFRRSRRRR